MALSAETIDRLKAQLLTSGLSQQNQPLYQIINQLIDALRGGLVEIQGINTVISSGGTTVMSQQYPEDTPSVDGELLTMAGVVRKDTIGSLVDTDGDRTELQVNADGALRVDGSAVTQSISAVALPLPAGAATLAGQTQPGVDIGDVTVNNGVGGAAVNIQDGGNSITVDGVVAVSNFPATQPVSGTVTANQGTPAATADRWPVQITDGTDLALVTPAGEQNVIATAQPGVDIGDVTVNNPAGAGAVNIQDGGNSITVDGAVSVSNFPAVQPVSAVDLDIRDLVFATDKVDVSGSSVNVNNGVGAAAVNIQDGGNSITVDGVVAITGPVAVTGPLTDAELRATPVPVSGIIATGGLTDAELRATPVPVSAVDLDIRNLVFATDKVDTSGSTLGANSGVDIGDVTVNNGAGAAAVNIQDGGNSITVDGIVAISGTVQIAGGTTKTLKRAVVALTATGDVIAAVSTKRLKIYQYALQSRTNNMTSQFRDGAAGALLGLRWGFNQREGASSGAVDPATWLFQTTAGNALQAVITGSGTVDIEVSYWDDDTT